MQERQRALLPLEQEIIDQPSTEFSVEGFYCSDVYAFVCFLVAHIIAKRTDLRPLTLGEVAANADGEGYSHSIPLSPDFRRELSHRASL